ncbi:MAG: hypothetical protein D6729_03540 [Deltaproteobacteria bacterium]|nr:MAG: hypothetical protein D6729_03540 [Deltaproteobacteria bacterium]
MNASSLPAAEACSKGAPRLAAAAVLLLMAVVPGCDRDVGDLVVFVNRSSRVAEDPLDPAVVGYLELRVEGPGMGVATRGFDVQAGADRPLVGIPTGPDRVLTLNARTEASGRLVARGRTLPLEVTPGVHRILLYVGLVDRLSAASGPGLAFGRSDAALAALPDGELLLVGGASDVGVEAHLARIDPDAGTLVEAETCGPPPGCLGTPRIAPAAVATSRGVLVLGGGDGQGTAVAAVELCDGRLCLPVASLPAPRWGGVVVAHPDGGALWVGGETGEGSVPAITRIGPAGEIEALAPLDVGLEGAAAALASPERLVVLGGETDAGDRFVALARDLSTGRAVPVEVDAVPWRRDGTAVAVGEGRVLWIGGRDAAGEASAAIDLYDAKSDRICPVGRLAAARWGATATRLDDGRVLVVGGWGRGGVPTAQVEVLDPRVVPDRSNCAALEGTLDREAQVGHLARARHAAARAANGYVVVVGGEGVDGLRLGSMEIWVPGA